MGVTMTAIAEQAGVSVTVVSRLLRGDPNLRISEARRREILRVSTALGGAKMRQRKRKLTQTIVVPVSRLFSMPDLERSLIATQRFHHFEKKLKGYGFRVHFNFFDPGDELEVISSLIRSAQACDGLLLLTRLASEPLSAVIERHQFPHVAFDSEAERFQLNTVTAHAADGTRQAVEHLISLGHRRFGFVGQKSSPRYSLMVAALAAEGISFDDSMNCWIHQSNSDVLDQEYWRGAALSPFKDWLARGPGATALICANDHIALGISEVMRQGNMLPGRELSIVGFDNIEVRGSSRSDNPALTTIDNPTDLIGQRGAELLLNQVLHNQTQIVHERIPAELIVRSSTGPCLI